LAEHVAVACGRDAGRRDLDDDRSLLARACGEGEARSPSRETADVMDTKADETFLEVELAVLKGRNVPP
jgi:hypothetical protein